LKVAFVYTENEYWALGMRSISAVLKETGIATRLLFMPAKDIYSPEIIQSALDLVEDVDLIGISSFSRGATKAIQLLKHFKKVNKLTVWGGVHATLNPEECTEYADLVCRGEGEGFILDLVRCLESGREIKEVCNAAWRNHGHVVLNPCRELICDLDSLPLPDFSFEEEFHLKDRKFVKIQSLSDSQRPIVFNGSRGCARQCTYCSNAKLKQLYSSSQGYARKMTVARFLEHAVQLRRIFPDAKYFFFGDEDFFARKLGEIEEFAVQYKEQVGLPFECMASAPQITEDKLRLLTEAGLWRLGMGIESGSDRTKKEVYRRFILNQAILKSADTINKFPQVVPLYFFIIGNPYEEREDLLQTYQLIYKLPRGFYTRIYNLIFIPGTQLYEQAVRDKIITGWADSAFEVDFLAGFKYHGHSWKQRNLYLNGLIFLMEGRSTTLRVGLLPRCLLNLLIHPGIIQFNEKVTYPIRALIHIKYGLIKLRSLAAFIIRALVSDYVLVYNRRLWPKLKLTSFASKGPAEALKVIPADSTVPSQSAEFGRIPEET